MKRIITPFTASNPFLDVLTLAARVSKEHAVPVHGIFLKEPAAGNDFNYLFPNDLSFTEKKGSTEDIKAENRHLINSEIALFEDECEAEGVTYKIEIDIPLEQLIDETLDTDLVITSTKADFLEALLPHLHCPAYLVSESEVPAKIVLLYDGSDSCSHAIKMFISYFPEWKGFPTSVVSINTSKKEQKEIELYTKNELQARFENLTIQSLQGNKEKELIAFLEQDEIPTLVVMGAFGRNAVSRFFNESLANTVIENTGCNLFIAH